MGDLLRRSLGAIVALAGLALAPSQAGAEPAILGTLVTPERLSWPATTSVLYYLRIATGPSDELFSVRLTPPSYGARGAVDEGESIDGPRAIALQGPGTIGATEVQPRVLQPCSQHRDRIPGYATGAETVDLLIPANSTSTLAVRYATGAAAPRADSDFRLLFTAMPRLVGRYEPGSPFYGREATLGHEVSVRTSGPAVTGVLAPRIRVATNPASGAGAAVKPRRIAAGQKVAIAGRVAPAQRGVRVVLREVAARPDGHPRRIAIVRTDGRGRFAYRGWRPGRGLRELSASVPRQGNLAATTVSCPRLLRVAG